MEEESTNIQKSKKINWIAFKQGFEEAIKFGNLNLLLVNLSIVAKEPTIVSSGNYVFGRISWAFRHDLQPPMIFF